MADDQNASMGKTLDRFSGKRDAGKGPQPQVKSTEADFAGDFTQLKVAVIRPAFENVGSMLKARGHEINISEELGGKISIHMVPAGVKKSIHPYDWFPTFSLFGAPYTKSVGVHGRNARPSSGGSERGDYKLAQVSKEVVEKELMKFVGEIGNW
jgi:hypothetical protein